MITPIDFQLADFITASDSYEYKSLAMEDLKGSDLVDNLILLHFIELPDVRDALQEKYHVPFVWLNIDPTPPDWRQLADKYQVFLQRGTSDMIVYVQLGQELDNAALQVDIPNYSVRYVYIADCNYRLVKSNLTADVLSTELADFRPLLLFRRLIIDCMEKCGTDIHFQSVFVDKVPSHSIKYRVKGELETSAFRLDGSLMRSVVRAVIAKLSPASAADLDSLAGVTTDISDIFGDGTTDIRFTGQNVAAGIYAVGRIQTVTTTTFTVDQLGFPKGDVEMIREIAKRRTGLTLVTGKIRSGKNTTIFAMVNEINDLPIRIVEYSNPIEVRMPHIQMDYHGDIDQLTNALRNAKKEDIDIAILNEIPDSAVAFAVRDLVNSAIGVVTTTHVDRIWHVPNKLHEFFDKDYKTIISQLNAVINQKMFRRWSGPGMQKRMLNPQMGDFEKFAHRAGVRQYFVPTDISKVKYSMQPLVEILIFTDEMKTAMLNFDEMWKAEQMLRTHIERAHGTIENKLAEYINEGLCSLDELRSMY